ncbi:MAG: hypothetical protein AB1540_08255 [Bdellovibrionota bacterium]
MLKQCSAQDLLKKKVTRANGFIVICMRHYPRYLKKELRDSYSAKLAPSEELFTEFNSLKTNLGNHNAAFRIANYESKFDLSDEGLEELKGLSQKSQVEDVYLVCQCGPGELCHRDLLLILARHYFHVETETPRFPYRNFVKRLEEA